MPDRLEAAMPAVPCSPSSESRAARLKGFERERLIVDYLNRGVSVSEVAAHVGVGEKRMRAIIREILARRMPAPPQEFVAIQVSRLNEALLVAYSAMSPTNLGAVDRVVKIVRELDRYHGFNAAEWRLPKGSRLEADADGERALEALFDSPENPSQELEILDSAPGNGAPSPAMREEDREAARDATPFLETPLQGALGPEESMDGGPENSAQELGNIGSAPGNDALPGQPSGTIKAPFTPYPERVEGVSGSKDVSERTIGAAQWIILRQAQDDIVDVTTSLIGRLGSCIGPENPLQEVEKLESAPGYGLPPHSLAERPSLRPSSL